MLSKKKGARAELEIVNIFNERFNSLLSNNQSWGTFSRSVGSGNRWSHVSSLSDAALQTYSGDITCPKNFLFSIESKVGYNDTDLFNAFTGKIKVLDDFLHQALSDSERSKRHPILIWKKDRKPRLCFIHKKLVKLDSIDIFFIYNDWICLSDTKLLSFGDEFFFNLFNS